MEFVTKPVGMEKTANQHPGFCVCTFDAAPVVASCLVGMRICYKTKVLSTIFYSSRPPVKAPFLINYNNYAPQKNLLLSYESNFINIMFTFYFSFNHKKSAQNTILLKEPIQVSLSCKQPAIAMPTCVPPCKCFYHLKKI